MENNDEETIKAIGELLPEISKIHLRPESEPNFFQMGGRGFYENPVSDIMKIFMEARPGRPAWLTKALFACLPEAQTKDIDLTEEDWNTATVEREVSIQSEVDGDGYKRLDLVVTTSRFILGIENKVFHTAYNPFETYNKLLEKRKNDSKVIKCITAPKSTVEGNPPDDWPVISYDKIYNKAMEQWGKESISTPFGKWHIFYQEFLSHLNKLAHPELENMMDKATIDFIEKNYSTLRHARKLLNTFDDDLIKEMQKCGLSTIGKSLSVDENKIKLALSKWGGDIKALRFFPEYWDGKSEYWDGKSQLVLCFSFDEDENKMIWFTRAYLYENQEKARNAFGELKDDKFRARTDCDVLGTWYEEKGRCLALDTLPINNTKEGALEALGALAAWVKDILVNK